MNTAHTFLAVMFGWSFAFALLVLWHLFFRCRHDWEPVVERELPSRAETLHSVGENIAKWDDPTEIASKCFFAIISCKKCGAVKEFEVRT